MYPRRVIRRTACAGGRGAGRGHHERTRAASLAAPGQMCTDRIQRRPDSVDQQTLSCRLFPGFQESGSGHGRRLAALRAPRPQYGGWIVGTLSAAAGWRAADVWGQASADALRRVTLISRIRLPGGFVPMVHSRPVHRPVELTRAAANTPVGPRQAGLELASASPTELRMSDRVGGCCAGLPEGSGVRDEGRREGGPRTYRHGDPATLTAGSTNSTPSVFPCAALPSGLLPRLVVRQRGACT